MKFKVIISKKDIAGQNIKEELIKNGFLNIYETNEDSIYSDKDKNINKIEADFLIFATRH